jgi:hypothetical protein
MMRDVEGGQRGFSNLACLVGVDELDLVVAPFRSIVHNIIDELGHLFREGEAARTACGIGNVTISTNKGESPAASFFTDFGVWHRLDATPATM